MKHTRLISFVLILMIFTTLPLQASAVYDFPNNQKAIAAAAESVVMLTVYDEAGEFVSSGSGFVIYDSHMIVTNAHLFDDTSVRVEAQTESGNHFELDHMYAVNSRRDIAVLTTKTDTGLTPLEIGSNESMAKASRLIAIGSPLGYINTVSDGLYTGLVPDDFYYDSLGYQDILFSAPIASGSSGGALFDSKGKVIGVTSYTYEDTQGISLAIPIEDVVDLIQSHIASEHYSLDSALPFLLVKDTLIDDTEYWSPMELEEYYTAHPDERPSESESDSKTNSRTNVPDTLFGVKKQASGDSLFGIINQATSQTQSKPEYPEVGTY